MRKSKSTNKATARIAIFFLAALITLALAAPSGLAQTGTGTVQGRILDANRAVIPGADITITNQDTNISRKTVASGDGNYAIGALPPGPYMLAVEVPGFKKWTGKLVLEVGQTAVVDAVMQVGDIATEVEVVGAAPPITLESAEVSDVKDAVRIRQLPLNGRAISNLFDLTPGVEGGGNPRVNGLKVGSVEMTIDGISLVDRFGGGIARVQPGLDTIQEFRIETTGSDAQFSRPATVTLVTKSGTNAFHGSVFETHRNNAAGLRARRREDGNTSSKLIRNEFGASAGGPVYLGNWYNGRDKTFWFAAYEGLRNRQSRFVDSVVPTAALWAGDFSGIVNANGVQTHIYDPLTTDARGLRQQFPNDIIPGNRIHPFYKQMQALTALPTSTVNPFQANNFQKFYPDNLDTNTFTVRGDHKFSDQDNLSARFSRSQRLSQVFGGVFGNPVDTLENGFGTGRSDTKVYSTSIRETHVFSPTFLSELLVAGHRSNQGSGTLADFTDWPKELGLPNPFNVTGWPTLGAGIFAWDSDNRHDQKLTAYVVEENLSWLKGKHSLKFGGKVRYEYNNVRELQQAQGSHTFGNAWTALYDPVGDQTASFTGDGLAAMALGVPTFLSNQYNRGYFYFEQQEIGLYFHDSWKAHPRLTLDLGVRWDKWTAYEEKYNRLVNVDLNNFANQFQVVTPKDVRMEDLPGIPSSVLQSYAVRGLTWTTARNAGLPDNLVKGDNNNFAPRIGAAFRITDKTVLRGGYGEYFWTMPLAQILQTSRTNPPLNLRFRNQLGSLDGTSTFGVRTTPRPEFFVGTATVDTEGIVFIPPDAQSIMPWAADDWKDGRAQSWHLTLEREVMRNTALRLSYIGDHGRDMEQRFALNNQEAEYNYVARTGQNPPANRAFMRVNPNWNFSAANRTGFSNTHSAQVEVERKYSTGLAFQFFYTFTRSLTTSDAGGFTSGNGAINATDGQFQVPENIQLLGGNSNLSYDQRLRLGYYNNTNIPPHRIRYNGIYDLPFGRGKQFGGDVARGWDTLIGGWQIAAIGDWRGGLWRSVGSGLYWFGDPTLAADERLEMTIFGRHQRLWFRGDFDPRQATNVSQEALQALVPVNRAERVLRPLGAAFDNRLPQTLSNGTVRQTPITDTVNPNPGRSTSVPAAGMSTSRCSRTSTSREGKARFSADFFNFFNHPVDGAPSTTTGLQDLSVQANEPRIIQFSLRLDW